MQTVGEILKNSRIAKKLTINQVELKTKIRAKFIEAIESDDYSQLPSLSYAKGFVKNYSEFLGLDSEKILAFFRRQNEEPPKSAILPKSAQEINHNWWELTPGRFIAFLVVVLIAVFLGYFGIQYRRLQSPPKISIDKPANKMVSVEPRIELIGSTDPDASISVNGVSVIVQGGGAFFDQLVLQPGLNKITITATSRYGKIASKNLEIMFNQP